MTYNQVWLKSKICVKFIVRICAITSEVFALCVLRVGIASVVLDIRTSTRRLHQLGKLSLRLSDLFHALTLIPLNLSWARIDILR